MKKLENYMNRRVDYQPNAIQLIFRADGAVPSVTATVHDWIVTQLGVYVITRCDSRSRNINVEPWADAAES